jgi:hypothetical protein
MSEHDTLDRFPLSKPSAAPTALPVVPASSEGLVVVDSESQLTNSSLYAPGPAPLDAVGSFSAAGTVSAAALWEPGHALGIAPVAACLAVRSISPRQPSACSSPPQRMKASPYLPGNPEHSRTSSPS